MNFSRQALLGIGMIIGGSVMLYAMVQQIGDSNNAEPVPALVEKPTAAQAPSQPLTTDIDTEKRILAEKQKERAARVAEQEKRAQEFMNEQENAEAQALAKSRAENQQYMANSVTTGGDSDSPEAAQNDTDTSSVVSNKASATTNNAANSDKANAEKAAAQQQAEAKRAAEAKLKAEQEKKAAEQVKASNEAPTSPSEYTVKSGDGLIRLARQYNVPVEVLAQANNIPTSTSLQLGQTITIPSRRQVQRLEREAEATQQAREEKRKKEEALAKKSVEAKREAQQKLSEARKEVKETDAKGSFGVQVALADNQSKADELAKKFQSAGYEVKTSATSRGVRVIIGPERGKVAALALKDKINSDPKVNTTGAWVLYWR